MKRVLLISAICACFLSCQNLNNIDVETKDSTIDLLHFDSISSFEQVMQGLATGALTREGIGPRFSLFTKYSLIDIYQDPILKHDFRGFHPTRSTEDLTIYEAAGFDELVPDENLASLLNARAEICIDGKIYKISEQGTYCFDASLLESFNENYELYEESEGVLIDSFTYQLDNGIIRYATFLQDDFLEYYASDYYEESDNEDELGCLIKTKAPTMISSLQMIDYNKYPKYCSDAQTVAGKFFQSLIGRNKSFDYNFTNKKKFSSKLFYYDYLFWSSIGITTKMQKRTC